MINVSDHKPVIAITHGDLLSISERACVRVGLGNLLGVHPVTQIFDIPGDSCVFILVNVSVIISVDVLALRMS